MATQNNWNNQISNASIEFNGGIVNIGTDATTNPIEIGTAGARTVTIGSITGTASLGLQCGTNSFSIASASGTINSINRTGYTTQPKNSSFAAQISGTLSHVTGDGTAYTLVCANEIFDLHSDFDGTSTFTAPIGGIYLLGCDIETFVLDGNNLELKIVTTKRTYYISVFNNLNFGAINGVNNTGNFVLANMDLGDTAYVVYTVSGGTLSTIIYPNTGFYGKLIC